MTPWTAAYQASPSMGLSRREYWSGVPLPSPLELDYLGFNLNYATYWASLVAQTVKNPPANAGDPGSIPSLGRSTECEM